MPASPPAGPGSPNGCRRRGRRTRGSASRWRSRGAAGAEDEAAGRRELLLPALRVALVVLAQRVGVLPEAGQTTLDDSELHSPGSVLDPELHQRAGVVGLDPAPRDVARRVARPPYQSELAPLLVHHDRRGVVLPPDHRV